MRANVVLVDYGCDLDPAALRAVAEAATIQTHRDFGLPVPYGYGVAAIVRVAANPDDVREDEWVLGYLPDTDAGPLGYHVLTPSGRPRMAVFPFREDPRLRGLVETHEILEALVDPYLNRAFFDPFGSLIACEPADPVEPSWYPIAVRGGWIPVTNFVTPAYYQPLHYPNMKYDFLGQLRYPGEVLVGGYKSVLSGGAGWSQQINGFRRPYRSFDHELSRSRQRARGKRE